MNRDTGKVETVIVEYGFIDHQVDRQALDHPTYRRQLALAAARGAAIYFNKAGQLKERTIKFNSIASHVDNWEQSIRIILGDIELNNDNLVELRKFKPNEAVTVCFESQQVNLYDLPFNEKQNEDNIDLPEDLSEDSQPTANQELYLIEGVEEANPEDILQEISF
ncbi:MAG: hypothetical protein KGZ96_05710 [Clostridia bacterium]|jgi:hypothetical protein|nr:hypothetical protein [Clostridia bacterium]